MALVQAAAPATPDIQKFGSDLSQLMRTHFDTQLFVYPELHLSPLVSGGTEADAIEAFAEPIDGPRDHKLREIAADLNIWLAPGSFYERGADGRIYNTAAVYAPSGERVAQYRKIFPWRPYEKVSPGADFTVFDMPGIGRIGLSICYDAWFPEAIRHLAWMGAEVVLNVVKTPTADRAQETVLARANAIVNQIFVASVNAATPDGVGRSLLVDPQGCVRQETDGACPAVLSDVIDLDDVTNARRYGTAGVTRPWQHFQRSDAAVRLPLYGGSIDPSTWNLSPQERQVDPKS